MLDRKTMVLYCGGAPSLAPAAPVSPGAGGGGGGGGPPAVVAAANGGPLTAAATTRGHSTEGARGPFSAARIGGFPWPPQGLAEGARALIGGAPLRPGPLALIGPFEGAPRTLIGSGPAAPEGEEELDGCEPDEEGGAAAAAAAALLDSPGASSLEGEESDAASTASSDSSGGGASSSCRDDLRKVTLELLRRYLHQAARDAERGDDAKAAAAAAGGSGGGKTLLQGLMGRFGTPQAGGHREEDAPSPFAATTPSPCVAEALETLRRVGDGILDKHQKAFQGMLKKLEIKNEDDLKTVSEVATHVFNDGVTNWGRIVTLISFGAFVAKHLKSINQENSINTLAEIITDVLVTDKREWLLKHNAWEGFIRFFHVEDLEGSIRNVLVAFAGVAGVGASLAYLIR